MDMLHDQSECPTWHEDNRTDLVLIALYIGAHKIKIIN